MAQKVKSITAEIGIDSRKFTSGANAVKGKTNDLKSDFSKLAGSLVGVTASITAAGVALKKVYDTAKEGQAIENAEARLAAFAGGAQGATEVIDEMQSALGGAISRFDAAKQASTLFELGLASNAQEAASLSKTIMATGGNIGDFSLMIANESKMRLDLYGLSVADVTARQKELSAANKDLTSQETFAIAVKEQLAAKTEKLEAAGYQAVSAYDRLEAGLADLTDGYKKNIHDGVEPFVSSLADSIQEINKVQMQHNVLKDALEAGIITEVEYRRTVNMKNRAEEMYQLTVKDLTYELAKRAEAEQRVKTLMVDYTDAQSYAMKQQINSTQAAGIAEAEFTEEMKKQLEERNEAITKYNQFRVDEVGRFSDIERRYSEDSEQVAKDLASVQAELALRRKQGYAEWGSTVTGLLAKEEELKQKAKEIEDAHALATKTIILGYIEQKMAADGLLTDDEVNWLLAKGVEWGIYEESAIAAYQNAAAAADEAMKHFQDKTVKLIVKYMTEGNASTIMGGAGGGGTFGEGGPVHETNANGTNGPRVVPPGFLNDTYTIGLSSGEEYTVNTAHNASNSSEGNNQPTFEFDYDLMGESLALALERQGR